MKIITATTFGDSRAFRHDCRNSILYALRCTMSITRTPFAFSVILSTQRSWASAAFARLDYRGYHRVAR